MDPNKRITSEKAMADPYFSEQPKSCAEYVSGRLCFVFQPVNLLFALLFFCLFSKDFSKGVIRFVINIIIVVIIIIIIIFQCL